LPYDAMRIRRVAWALACAGEGRGGESCKRGRWEAAYPAAPERPAVAPLPPDHMRCACVCVAAVLLVSGSCVRVLCGL